jgi:hypothetical protein
MVNILHDNNEPIEWYIFFSILFWQFWFLNFFSGGVWTPFRRGVLDTTLFDKLCQWLATGRWFSPGSPISSTNKIDRHDITEILLKVALNTIKQAIVFRIF